jgi:hypothetical protein
LEPEMRAFQRDLAETLADRSAVCRVMDTTLIPAIVRVRTCRKGLFAGRATFGRSVSKIEWVYGFRVALAVDPGGVVTSFGLALRTATRGRSLMTSSQGTLTTHTWRTRVFSSLAREKRWLEQYEALVAATPQRTSKRAWPERDNRCPARKRQIIEGVIGQPKDLFGLRRHHAKTSSSLLARLAAKVSAYTCGQFLNVRLRRPLRQLARLLDRGITQQRS